MASSPDHHRRPQSTTLGPSRRTLLQTSAAFGGMMLAGCAAKTPQGVDDPRPPKTFAEALERITSDVFDTSPELATSLKIPVAEVGHDYTRLLDERSIAAQAELLEKVTSWIALLNQFDHAKLKGEDVISADFLTFQFETLKRVLTIGYGRFGVLGDFSPFVINQLDSAFLTLPDFLDTQHVLATSTDADAYLSRLSLAAQAIDDERLRMLADVEKGVIPPDFVLQKALVQVEGFLATPVAASPYVVSLSRRLAEIKALPTDLRDDKVARAKGIVMAEIYPALQALAASIKQVLPAATHLAGIWKQPRGAEYYAESLRLYTTTALTPDQIHELGLQRVAALTLELDKVLRSQSFTTGSVAARLQSLGASPEFLYPDSDDGRAALLADLNARMAAMQAELPKLFGRLPKAGVEIRRVPIFAEKSAPGGYYQPPSLDGSRPGAYYINLVDMAAWPKWSLPTLTYHEASPGHHLQTTLALEAKGLPVLRRAIWSAAYGEGWALYAEQLADEIGVYAKDPMGRLGYLQSQLFRAARLVVDTGLHAKQWSREEAIRYMVGVTGDTESSITGEVERYCVWPGQACAYEIGHLEFLRLREKARLALGPEFSLKEFHDQALNSGAVPLSTLETIIDAWVQTKRGR